MVSDRQQRITNRQQRVIWFRTNFSSLFYVPLLPSLLFNLFQKPLVGYLLVCISDRDSTHLKIPQCFSIYTLLDSCIRSILIPVFLTLLVLCQKFEIISYHLQKEEIKGSFQGQRSFHTQRGTFCKVLLYFSGETFDWNYKSWLLLEQKPMEILFDFLCRVNELDV